MKKTTKKSLLFTLAFLTLINAAIAEETASPSERFTTTKSQELKDAQALACENIDLTVKLYSDEEMEEKRKGNSNPFVETVDLLLEVYKNGEYMKLLSMDLIPLMVSGVFFVLVVLSLPLFFINICLCCCKGKETGRGCCIKCNLFVALLGLIGFATCCLMLAIYVKNVKSGMSQVNCSLNTLSNDLINGNTSINGYIGFFPLTNIIGSFTSDLDKLVLNHKGNLQQILDLDLKVDSKDASDSITTFYDKYKDTTTSDGDGTTRVPPISITEILPQLEEGALLEFKAIQDVCGVVEDGAEAAKTQVDNPDIQNVKKSLNDVIGLIDGISNTVHGSFSSIGKTFVQIDTNYEMGQLAFIIFCFVCLVAGLIMFLSLCCAVKNKGCQNFCVCRIAVSILGVCTFLFLLFSFVIGAVTFVTSSSCGLLQQFSTADGITKFVDLFSFDTQMKTILLTCLLQDGDGKLNSIFLGDSSANSDSSDMFGDVESILSVFDEYKAQLEKLDPNNNSLTIKAFSENIVKIGTGELPDHENIVEKLAELNLLMNCADEGYAFVADQCDTGVTTCNLIKDTQQVVPKPCQTSTKPQYIFSSLKIYLEETSNLINAMIDDSYGSDSSTPNSKLKAVLIKFRTAVQKFDLIKNDLSATLDLLQNSNIVDGANCKIMRAEFQSLETSLCFNFVPSIYKFMFFALIGSILFFSFIWHFCCGIFCLERSKEHGSDIDDSLKNTGDQNYHNPHEYYPQKNSKYIN